MFLSRILKVKGKKAVKKDEGSSEESSEPESSEDEEPAPRATKNAKVYNIILSMTSILYLSVPLSQRQLRQVKNRPRIQRMKIPRLLKQTAKLSQSLTERSIALFFPVA